MSSMAKQVKETIHLPCVVISLVACTSDDSLSTNQQTLVSLVTPFRYQTTVLGSPKEGSQKSGTVRFGILVLFTTYDHGYRNNCVPYCTILNSTTQWKWDKRELKYTVQMRWLVATQLNEMTNQIDNYDDKHRQGNGANAKQSPYSGGGREYRRGVKKKKV